MSVRMGWIVVLMITLFTINTAHTMQMTEIQLKDWRLITDGVMGGVSAGQMRASEHQGRSCLRLSGQVSTRNNGGFIQIAHDLTAQEKADAGQRQGIRLTVSGNREDYNLHLRTAGLWFPWQSFRATFQADTQWRTLEIPFSQFEGYKTSQDLDITELERIGIVAIGREFEADLCIAELGFF